MQHLERLGGIPGETKCSLSEDAVIVPRDSSSFHSKKIPTIKVGPAFVFTERVQKLNSIADFELRKIRRMYATLDHVLVLRFQPLGCWSKRQAKA